MGKRVVQKMKLEVSPAMEARKATEAFMRRCHELANQKGAREDSNAGFIRDEHKKLFGNRGNGVHIDVVKARVACQLQLDGFREAGIEDQLTENFLRNHKIFLKNTPEKLDSIMRDLFKEAIAWNKNPDKGGEMAVKVKKSKKVKVAKKTTKMQTHVNGDPKPKKSPAESAKRPVGKVMKLGIAATWAYLFESNEKSKVKMTDADITTYMRKEFPDRESKIFDHPNVVRGRYNRGLLTGGEAPKTPSVKYDEAKPKASPKKKAKPKKAAKKAKKASKKS